MWLQRTETWQVSLHEHGATALRLDAPETATTADNTRQVNAESAMQAWQAIESALPPAARLNIYLSSDIAKLALITGNDHLSERDWQTLAQAHFDSECTVTLDANWHTGKRAALAVDTALLQTIKDSNHHIERIASTATLMLADAYTHAGEQSAILCVRDLGGWVLLLRHPHPCTSTRHIHTQQGTPITVIPAKAGIQYHAHNQSPAPTKQTTSIIGHASFWRRTQQLQLLALTCYPANATSEQIAIEANRMTAASGLDANTKHIFTSRPSSDMTLQSSAVSATPFSFHLLQRKFKAKVSAALSLTVFLGLVVTLTQAWHSVGEQAQAVQFKQDRLNGLKVQIETAQQRGRPATGVALTEQERALQADWQQIFAELETLSAPNQGVQATSFSAQALGKTARLRVEVQADALEKFYETLKMRTNGTWRVASVNKARDDGVRGYEVLLVRGRAIGD